MGEQFVMNEERCLATRIIRCDGKEGHTQPVSIPNSPPWESHYTNEHVEWKDGDQQEKPWKVCLHLFVNGGPDVENFELINHATSEPVRFATNEEAATWVRERASSFTLGLANLYEVAEIPFDNHNDL